MSRCIKTLPPPTSCTTEVANVTKVTIVQPSDKDNVIYTPRVSSEEYESPQEKQGQVQDDDHNDSKSYKSEKDISIDESKSYPTIESEDTKRPPPTTNIFQRPWQVLRDSRFNLTPYEQREIHDFPEVYFHGHGVNCKAVDPNNPNHGFDDDRGDYILRANDHVGYRYEIFDMLGQGSFGQVVKVSTNK